MSKIGLTGSEVALPREPDATGYIESPFSVQGQRRSIDGTLQTCIAAGKRRWHVPVRGITAAQKSTLLAELTRQGDLSWIDPHDATWTVHVSGDITCSPTKDAEGYWDVVWDMEQV